MPHRSEGTGAAVGIHGCGAHDGGAARRGGGVGVVREAAAHARQRTPCATTRRSAHFVVAPQSCAAGDALSSCASRRPSASCARQPAASKAHPSPSSVGTTAYCRRGRARLSARPRQRGRAGAPGRRCEATRRAARGQRPPRRRGRACRAPCRAMSGNGTPAWGTGQCRGRWAWPGSRRRRRACSRQTAEALSAEGGKRQLRGATGDERRSHRAARRRRWGTAASRAAASRARFRAWWGACSARQARLCHEDGGGARARAGHVDSVLQLRARSRHLLRAPRAAEQTTRKKRRLHGAAQRTHPEAAAAAHAGRRGVCHHRVRKRGKLRGSAAGSSIKTHTQGAGALRTTQTDERCHKATAQKWTKRRKGTRVRLLTRI